MDSESLVRRIRDLRKSCDYTQEFVASYLDISRQAYSHYETGRNDPTLDALFKLAELYKMSINELICYLPSDSSKTRLQTNEVLRDYMTKHPIRYATGGIGGTALSNDALQDFLQFLDKPANTKKLKLLNRKEKELIYYFEQISAEDQDEIIEILKIKARKSHS
jgi:transcriptional regulator with XRE-family HTH domain